MDEKLKELSILAEKIYGLTAILKEYCKNNSDDTQENMNIYSLVECLNNKIGKLNVLFDKMNAENE